MNIFQEKKQEKETYGFFSTVISMLLITLLSCLALFTKFGLISSILPSGWFFKNPEIKLFFEKKFSIPI